MADPGAFALSLASLQYDHVGVKISVNFVFPFRLSVVQPLVAFEVEGFIQDLFVNIDDCNPLRVLDIRASNGTGINLSPMPRIPPCERTASLHRSIFVQNQVLNGTDLFPATILDRDVQNVTYSCRYSNFDHCSLSCLPVSVMSLISLRTYELIDRLSSIKTVKRS